ncbi:CFEM domain-containing protein [Colletotrichum navitas]|uniref:CFEM domain-containing protein n=1 Tax=Colletotrichum navitas TaxID=681940 RepID=A0AAD8PQ48_9PEZI|nr:CFEM domain-containing protein [Colletotrichum navitas]KAK1574201.1 CFEM domain-containing protein [Colletotrichum navitas]
MAAPTRFLALFACLLGLANSVCASAVTPLDLTALPGCAATCILQEMGRSDCGFANQTCLCADTAYNALVEKCVIANCTVKQGLATKNQTLTACGKPSSTKTDGTLEWLRVVLFIIPTFFFTVRMASKFLKLSAWGWDDTTFVFAFIVLASFLPGNYFITEAGSGRDVWTLTPDQITEVLLIVYIFNLLYATCLSLIKGSIILLYLRIFPDTKIRKVLWGTLAFNGALWIVYVVPAIFICKPISFFWNGWSGEMEGQCIRMHAASVSHSALQLTFDVVLLVILATQIWGLNMSPKKKIAVLLVFSTGIFFTAVGAYRVKSLTVFAASDNPTINTYEAAIWSHIELATGACVACFPSTRQVWNWMVPTMAEIMGVKSNHGSSKTCSSGSTSLPPPSDYDGKPFGKQSWLSRIVDDLNTNISLRDMRSVSATSLVGSRDPPATPVRDGEV